MGTRKRLLRGSSLLVVAVMMLCFVFSASAAFAYQQFTMLPGTAVTGQSVNTTFRFTKDPGDTPVIGDGVNSGTWQKIVVLTTPVANVAADGNWSNSPWQDGNGSAVFESQYSPWIGNNWVHVSPLGIRFLQPGTYTLQVGLTDDSLGSGGWLPGSMKTYTLTVKNPVSTSASSPVTIAVLVALGLGTAAAITVRKRGSAS